MRRKLRARELMCLFLILTSTAAGLSFLPTAKAQTAISIINPTIGTVGSTAALVANLTSPNGAFNVTFDNTVVAVGNATGNLVNVTFIVPETALGNHTVTILDLTANNNATISFAVTAGYSLNVGIPPDDLQLQEGDSEPIWLNLTGAVANGQIGTTITVQTPAGATFSKSMNITASGIGSGIVNVTYPEDFSGANTEYVGSYTVSAVNASATSFTIGLTNSTIYHRFQPINIKAIKYAPNENVTLTVSGTGIQGSFNMSVDSDGNLDYSNYTVPGNASVGVYSVNIISVSGPTTKIPADSQSFVVPGFVFNVTAKNLAGESVPNVDLRAFENEISVLNSTTDSNGTAVLNLETGNYTLQGLVEDTTVGENQFSVNENGTANFVLNLTDLNIRVFSLAEGAEIGIPEVSVFLTPENVTVTTDILGTAKVPSLLPGVSYGLNLSRYGVPFNFTQISNLMTESNPVPFFNVSILVTSFKLQVSAFKADGQPFADARVEANDLVGGISYNATTGSDGVASFQNVSFGSYEVEILDSTGNSINSTRVNVFQDQNVTVNCGLFGLSVTVTVTDYLGQPFANANVTLQGNLVGQLSQRTQNNGETTFNNLEGDSFTLSVYLSDGGNAAAVQSVVVQGSSSVSVKLSRYVLVAGQLVEAPELAIIILIVLSLLFVLFLEVYRWRQKSHKSAS